MSRTLVIAEPGCTHEGEKAVLLKLLETAHACGADVFKPQWTSDPIAMCERRHIGPEHPKRAFYERAYGWLAFPYEWHAEFRLRCKDFGLEYACSVFLPQDVPTIGPLVDYLKISSFEAADAVIADVAQIWSDRLLVSTGMMTDAQASEWEGFGALLHCVSAYPAPIEDLNLRVLWGRRSGIYRGFSDHSRHPLAGAVAVGAGADIIEAHYRLDDCAPSNPDYSVAFTPAEFTQYIQNIRDAETMLGSGEKKLQSCEQWAVPYRVTG